VGRITDLPTEEEHTSEEGNTVRTVREEGGKLLHLSLGPDGSILDLKLPDLGDTVEEITEEETVEEQTESSETLVEDVPDATDAARQRAEQLGVDLSEIEGSGAGGRITVKDVTNAAS
jgi:pyruvate/2-oxoglutarate dehydrogenase complex dihydrolipoamide acyltransferase (E2) component